MKKCKRIMVGGLVVAALAAAGCGSSDEQKSAQRVADGQPTPKVEQGGTGPRVDTVLCDRLRSELTGWETDWQTAQGMSTGVVEGYITDTLQPELERIISGMGQLRDEATVAADQRRLDSGLAGLQTIYGGLSAIAADDVSGVGQVTQGVGQLTGANGPAGVAICGSLPNASS